MLSWQLLKLLFKNFQQCQVHSKIERVIQRLFLYLPPQHMHSLPHYQHPYQSCMFVTIDEPTLTNHYCPKSIVCIRFHLWCFTFCVFGQMYNDMYQLEYHTEYFHWLKNPPPYACSSVSTPQAATDFLLFVQFCLFLQCHCLEYTVYSLFRLASFT